MNRLLLSSVRDTEKKIYKYQRERNSFPKIPVSILQCTSYSPKFWSYSTDLIRSDRQERSSKLDYGFNIPEEVSESSYNLTHNYVYLHQYQLFQVNKVDYGEHDK